MKKKLLIVLILSNTLFLSGLNAQWCIPPTAMPYNNEMPGITRVILNTIDRISSDLENFPNNSYVNTGLSTDLVKGQTYSISITFTIDPNICLDMNIRVWVDYNNNGILDDAGETVILADNQAPGTYTGSFVVPTTVSAGTKRMRVTAKMTPNGGHSMPTPCDIPSDPLGYHGEIEDYDVNLLSPTEIQSLPFPSSDFTAFYNSGKINFSFSLNRQSEVNLILMDLQGNIVREIFPKQELLTGKYLYSLSAMEADLSSGIYLSILTADKNKIVKRIVVN